MVKSCIKFIFGYDNISVGDSCIYNFINYFEAAYGKTILIAGNRSFPSCDWVIVSTVGFISPETSYPAVGLAVIMLGQCNIIFQYSRYNGSKYRIIVYHIPVHGKYSIRNFPVEVRKNVVLHKSNIKCSHFVIETILEDS